MSSYHLIPLGSRFTTTRQAFIDAPELPFDQVLPVEVIDQAARDEDLNFAAGADDIYTPAVTLWAFLAQAMSASKSCVAAVARVAALRIALGLPACSAHTGAYCKARAKLAEDFLEQLTYTAGEAVEDQAPDRWRWHNRRVLLTDGFELTASDTPANQQVYPQPSSQQPGLGFPMIRVVVLLTFATACLVGAALGPYQGKETGETALFRELLDRLRAGDIAVADRYHCSYWQVALLQERGADAAFRLHQRRHYDFRLGRRLGSGDHIVTWVKPQRPVWMDEATYARLPDTLTVREVRFQIQKRGCRTKDIIVATTLLNHESYAKTDIADLYHQRWHVEIDHADYRSSDSLYLGGIAA
jgi:DDE family transposase